MLLPRLPRTPAFASTLRRSVHVPADPATLKWDSLGFGYLPTKTTVFAEFTEGQGWGRPVTSPEPYVRIHALSNVLHYGQALFEGLKAFAHADGNVALFRVDQNAKRMQFGCNRLGMPPLPAGLFEEACAMAVRENAAYVPPFGSNGSLYLRPFMFGHGPKLGLGKAPSYTFGVVANPVGNYYPQGVKPVKAVVLHGYDRAAPHGAGNAKCAGNYAPDVVPSADAAKRGYTVVLYLDAAKHKYVEEFSTSNFIAITKDKKKFVTPDSESILRSVTNDTLQILAAEELGLKVERRKVSFASVGKRFSEVAACGTAVVITPISDITDESVPDKPVNVKIGDGTFPVMQQLYQRVRDIQNGVVPDKRGWLTVVGRRAG